jgi:hypothetical protein
MSELDLFSRLRDLHDSLGGDIDWLEGNRRPDGLKDLGERLTELGGDLLRRATELNDAVLATLPADRRLPEACTGPDRTRPAHLVAGWPIRSGLVYLAVCGAACYPYYGRDTAGRIAGHPRCPACTDWSRGA